MRGEQVATALAALALLAACPDEPATPADTMTDAGGDADVTDTDVDDGDLAPDADAPDTISPPTTMGEVCAGLAAVVCDGVFACCQDRELRFPDAAACRDAFAVECVAMGATEDASLAAGTASVDAGAWQACLAATAEGVVACEPADAVAQQQHCAGVVVANASAGQACEADQDGMRCDGGEGVCFPEPGQVVCKHFGASDEPCSAAPCAPGLLCITDPAGGPAVCDERRADGEPCPAPAYCADGLTCVANLCEPQLGDGEPCDKWFDCGPGLTCDPYDEICAAPAALGDECVSLTHCADGLSCEGIVADRSGFTPGRCVPSLCAPYLAEPAP